MEVVEILEMLLVYPAKRGEVIWSNGNKMDRERKIRERGCKR
jgi:hypothetical protein